MQPVSHRLLKAKEHILARFTDQSVGLQQQKDCSKLLWNYSLSCSSINREAVFFVDVITETIQV